jgi:hypothetical protein
MPTSSMKLRVTIATTLTPAPLPTADLPAGDRYPVAAGQTLTLSQPPASVGDHWRLTLAEPLAGRTVWYVLAAHGELVAAETATPAAGATDEAEDEETKPAKGDVGCGIVVAILGLLCLLVPVSQVLSSAPEVRLRWLGWAGLFGGVSLTAVGVWYGVDSFTQERRSRREHLQRTFYAMVEAHNGEFSLLQYAKAADISGQQARAYLDERAQEFNATFEVDMDGGIIYRFR